MGNILNPDKDNSFIGLVKAKDCRVFVDKTDLLLEQMNFIAAYNKQLLHIA